MTVVILTYHAVEPGPAPLCVDPEAFRAHVDALHAAGAVTLTISQLAEGLRGGSLPARAVALTFDDGCASAVRAAAPLLAERGMTATYFCVAGYLGRTNAWPSQPASVPRLALATASELVELGALGFEIGGHGFEHMPLAAAPPTVVERELVEGRRALEDAVGVSVRTFAYPYGIASGKELRSRIETVFEAACGTRPDRVSPNADLYALPRIDAHYVRSPRLLARVVTGRGGTYLAARRAAARARTLVTGGPAVSGVAGR
jgi:peptidoglycan/xylan/chitin deacetylase (PgdA/CDA1 family)